MELQHVYQRRTFKFSPGWAHLDDYDFVATLRVTPFQKTREGNGYDDGGSWVAYTRLPAGSNWRTIARAVEQSMGGSNCRHEYDCCGCSTRRVFTRLVAPRRLMIRVSISYNY